MKANSSEQIYLQTVRKLLLFLFRKHFRWCSQNSQADRKGRGGTDLISCVDILSTCIAKLPDLRVQHDFVILSYCLMELRLKGVESNCHAKIRTRTSGNMDPVIHMSKSRGFFGDISRANIFVCLAIVEPVSWFRLTCKHRRHSVWCMSPMLRM